MSTIKTYSRWACGLAAATVLCGTSTLHAAKACCCSSDNPYIGRWALTLPNQAAGWLGVEMQADNTLKSAILWGGGSVVPTSETRLENGSLIVLRKRNQKKDGKPVVHVETITAKREGDLLSLTTETVDENGKQLNKSTFTGKKIADLPPRPDLSKVKFGTPLPLLAQNDLSGWQIMNKNAPNFWSIKDGILSNLMEEQPDGKKPHGTNIRTEAVFEDFNLKTDVRVPPNGNSGIYLRGIYEVQIAESYGKPRDPHFLGALYSRITPSVSAEKPANEWQTLDITLVDRHLTVILNGQNIIDNQPVLGCTGGALTSDETLPGPIYLQGDHTNVDYRNMVLTPIVK